MSAASGEAGKSMETFEGGATRSDTSARNDPEGYMSAIAIERYCEYMTKHRVQADGSIRDSDNWQKGMPYNRALKGLWRHMMHLWIRFRGFNPSDKYAAADSEEDLCAIFFNTQVMLHQLVKERLEGDLEKEKLMRAVMGGGAQSARWRPPESQL